MKKILLTFVLLVGIVAGLFAQKLTYQAVIRDNNQQLVVNTAVKATVTIDFAGDQADYTTTITDVSTNLHGLLSIEFGDESLVGRDWTGATIAVKVVNAATSSIVYVNDEPRPVSAVPYALSVDGVAIQQYLTEHKYVTEMQVGNQIHDSISNVAKSHTHSNKALLDTYTQTEANLADAVGKKHSHENMAILNATMAPYTDADSTKLDGIESGAQKNVQSDWKQTDGSKDDYIKNKPSITDTVNNILSTGGYVTADALDSRHYLTSDSTVITTMQGHISTNKTNIQTNAGTISALTTKEQSDSLLLAGRIDALENASMDCNDVKDCIKDTLSKYTPTADLIGLLQQLEDRIAALSHKVDSLAALIPGGDTTEVPDGQPCPGAKTVSDGTNTYNTVKIGKQCWMKENLRTNVGGGVYPQNDHHQTVTGEDTVTYGRLYTWTAMMNGKPSSDAVPSGVQGICPTGWHVPSDAEWTQLTTYVNSVDGFRCGTDEAIAKALASKTGWSRSESACNVGGDQSSNNATGFSAVPAGVRSSVGGFADFGNYAQFWSATQHDGDYALCRYLESKDSHVNRTRFTKPWGFSVRCLKDEGGSSATLPTVTTTSVSNITHNSATSGGNVTADGGANVTARGVCWSTSQNPTIADSHTTDGSGTGSFTSGITYVTDTTTTYYVRAYATNSKGTAYGNQVNFTIEVTTDGQPCPSAPTVSDGEGHIYNTVKIGNQCWMKENLRTKTSEYGNVWTKPDADSTIYGRYYDWAAVMQGKSTTNYPVSGDKVRGICPEGWHVPSDAEWDTLTTYVKSVSEYVCDDCSGTDDEDYTYCIAKALSQPTGWSNTGTGCNAGNTGDKANLTGFSAVPAGSCFYDSFDAFGSNAYFWSATQDFGSSAWSRALGSDVSFVYRGLGDKDNGFSVRCLKDEGGSSATLPTVTTTSVSNITHNSATSGGNVTADGGANVTARGVCWSTSQNPTIADSHTTDGSGTGSFTSGITYVTDATTTYYVRAYATNTVGMVYGNQVSFTTAVYQPCPGAPTVSDGTNTYNTVKIGNQCWMKENLRTTTKRNNVGNIYTNNTTDGYNAETYGYYYDWAAVMQNESGDKVRGICPEGWHVPSDAEWDTLTKYVYNSANPDYKCSGCESSVWEQSTKCIAKALASTTGWSSNTSEGCNAGNTGDKANATSFSAVPAGHCFNGDFDAFGGGAYFWSAAQVGRRTAWFRNLSVNDSYMHRSFGDKGYGFSVRCLKDEGLPTVTTDSASTVTNNSAKLYGNVTDMGEKTEVNAGFKYGTSESTLTSIVVKDAAMTATDQFSCDITNLTANTQYYFKAFAANGTDTVYGEVKNFTTKDLAVATNDATEVKSTAATLNGKLTELKGYENANAGFKYGTSESTLTSIVVKDDAMTATGLFSCDLVGLTANTKYYFKAFAANGTDTVYGEVKNFTTKDLAVATNDATEVKSTAATLNGKLTELKGYENANAGFKYGTSESTLTSIVVKDDAMTATGLFSCDLVGLTANTKYYFKAFAANGTDTVYGEVKNFTTKDLAVATNDATEVKSTAATLNGKLTELKGYENANAGFKYGTSESTLTSIVAKDTAMTATGLFSCDIDGLTVNTKYYFKAFAANGTDTVYGEVKNFRTLSNNPCPNTPTVTDIDNNEYNTVQIGDQCWMAENLRTTTKRNNVGNIYTNNTTDGYNAETYGYYYDWAAVMQNESGDKVRGICPEGWHVPSDAEWDTLTKYVYNSANPDYKCSGCESSVWEQSTKCIAKALASTTGWSSNTSEGCNAGNTGDKANATSFSAVPAGYYFDGSSHEFGSYAYFWSATQDDDYYAWSRYLCSSGSGVSRFPANKDTGYSVRCLKDN
ncbi:MAG: hypothetical protein MJZ52_03470 [Bacteroidales bacterium]|nr:hypothetical protein [Bacteroidales bacterium]